VIRLPGPIFQGPREGLGALHASGKGIGVAILDSGIAEHPDLKDRVQERVSTSPDLTGPVDWVGHGTHVATIVAGDGESSQGRFQGVAPQAHLVSVRVAAPEDAPVSVADRYAALIDGLDWAVENRHLYNIRVVNLSVGFPLVAHQDAQGKSLLLDPLDQAIERAHKAGLVMVAAAGNQGSAPGSMSNTPAHHPKVITVGASHPNGTPDFLGDDRVAEFSSRGPSAGKGRPDLLAPGVNIMGGNVAHSRAERHNDQALDLAHQLSTARGSQLFELATRIIARSGDDPALLDLPPEQLRDQLLSRLDPKPTSGFLLNGHPAYIALHGSSMSAPIVSGIVACMLEVNPLLGPDEVKDILTGTARPLKGWDINAQGAGVVDAESAIAEAARRRETQA